MPQRASYPVTIGWIIACVAAFAGQATGMLDIYQWGMVPAWVELRPWTIGTSAFLHADIVHLLMNMLALFMIGKAIEAEIGSFFTMAILVLSGIAGSLTYLVLNPGSTTVVVGASGAVFGLMGALLVLHFVFRTGALGQVLALVGINAVYGFVTPGIAWEAHLGGLALGAALTLPIAYAKRRPKQVDPPPGQTYRLPPGY